MLVQIKNQTNVMLHLVNVIIKIAKILNHLFQIQ